MLVPRTTPGIPDEIEVWWVGDNDHGLAHLVRGILDERYDLSICGVELWCPARSKAEGRPRCSPCSDMASGELKGYF